MMLAEYRKRRDFVVPRLRQIPGVSCNMPEGAFYAYPNISCALGKNGINTDARFRRSAAQRAFVAVVPGEAFGTDQHIRISYATSMAELERGLDRLQQFIEKAGMNVVIAPRSIEPQFFEKPWGSPRIEPWFESRGSILTGEVWFPAGNLLIKFLFTSDDLSVQVHPDDEYAGTHENSLGKTEMWHILRADPGARIAVGFKRPLDPDELIPAAKSGKIVDLLNWIEVHPGETYFIPAGTVHAIGGGIALCEIQQKSDVTYRLYDYNRDERDRPLHLEQAKAVAHLGCHMGKSIPRKIDDAVQLLVDCPYFKTYSAAVDHPRKLNSRILIVLDGQGLVNGEFASAGQVFQTIGSDEWFVEPEKAALTGPMNVLLTS